MAYARMLTDLPTVSFVGQFTRRMNTALRLVQNGSPVPVFSDWRDMVNSLRPDMALIALPASEVFQIAELLLAKPMSVVIDGAPGGKVKPTKRLLALAQEKGIRLAFANPISFHGAARVMEAVLAKKALGDIASVSIQRLTPIPSSKGREARTLVAEALYEPLVLLHRLLSPGESTDHELRHLESTPERLRLSAALHIGKVPVRLSMLCDTLPAPLERWSLHGQRGCLVWSRSPKAETLRIVCSGQADRILSFPDTDPLRDAFSYSLLVPNDPPPEHQAIPLRAVSDVERLWEERASRERRVRGFAETLPSLSWDEFVDRWEDLRPYGVLDLLPPLIAAIPGKAADERLARWLRLAKRIGEQEPLRLVHLNDALDFAKETTEKGLSEEEAWDLGGNRSFTQQTFVLRLDNRCNEACLFCNVKTEAHRRLDHDTQAAKLAIRRQHEAGASTLVLTGGEPTLRNDLSKLISFAHDLGMRVDLQTNALLLDDPALALDLADAGLAGALVSLHSHREDVSDMLTRHIGSLPRTLGGIDNLLLCGVSVRLSHVLTTHNATDLPGFVRWLGERLPAVRDVDVMINQHMGEGKNHPELLPRFSDLAPHLTQALALASERGIRLNNALTFPPCLFGDSPEQTLEYKRMIAFERHGQGPDPHTLLVAREKVKSDACAGCRYNPYCFGVWRGYADVHGLDELRPIPLVVDPNGNETPS